MPELTLPELRQRLRKEQQKLKFLDQELKNGDIDKLKQQWLTVENSLK